MPEPSRIRVQRITFRNPWTGDLGEVNVRSNRTPAETRAQFDRIYDNYPYERLSRFAGVYSRTMRALDATGRMDNDLDWRGSGVLVRRRNNRRI